MIYSKRSRWTWALTALCLFPNLARGGTYCASREQVNQYVTNCEDNEYVSDAAVTCLNKFENSVAVQQAAVSGVTAAQATASKQSQAGKQANAILDYNLSEATLSALIADAQRAQKEVGQFYVDLALPEDSDNPDITGPDIETFLDSDACYKDNKDVVVSVMRDFDNYTSQLLAARDASAALKANSSKDAAGLTSLSAGANKGRGTGNGAQAIPGGKQVVPASDITGVRQDEQKQQQPH